MDRRISLMACGIGAGLVFAADAAQAQQTPCIDTRPVGFSGQATALTFGGSGGRTIFRTNVLLLGYDPANKIMTIEDAGQRQSLNLAEWTSLKVAIQRPPQHVQMPLPMSTPVTDLRQQSYRLASMKVADGVISFGDCAVMTGPGRREEVKFNGTLTFDTNSDRLTVDGMFFSFSFPSMGPGGNPGMRK